MKKTCVYLFIIVWWVLLFAGIPSCNPIDYHNKECRWIADLSQPGRDLLIRGRCLDRIKNDLEGLIKAVNGSDRDPESFRTPPGTEPLGPPKLKLLRFESDLVVVEVINAVSLTQRMGSTGADAFLAEATFTLTEFPGAEAVEFRFPEGDHAAPGTFTRADFLDRWEPLENRD